MKKKILIKSLITNWHKANYNTELTVKIGQFLSLSQSRRLTPNLVLVVSENRYILASISSPGQEADDLQHSFKISERQDGWCRFYSGQPVANESWIFGELIICIFY